MIAEDPGSVVEEDSEGYEDEADQKEEEGLQDSFVIKNLQTGEKQSIQDLLGGPGEGQASPMEDVLLEDLAPQDPDPINPKKKKKKKRSIWGNKWYADCLIF